MNFSMYFQLLLVHLTIEYARGEKNQSLVLKQSRRNIYNKLIDTLRKFKNNKNVTNRGISNFPLKNFDTVRYFATIYVGTPPSSFQVLLDSLFTECFLVSPQCDSSDDSCSYFERRYDPSNSLTSQNKNEDFYKSYLDGSQVVGSLYLEKITMGDLVAPQAQIGVVTSMSGFTAEPMDGICGYSYMLGSNFGTPGILQSFYSNPNNEMSNAIISMYLPKFGDGLVTFNGWDENKFSGQIAFYPIKRKAFYYELIMMEYKIEGIDGNCGGLLKGGDGNRVIFDTDTYAIYGPTLAVAKIARMLGTTGELEFTGSGVWVLNPLNANFLPPITFKFYDCENCGEGTKEFVLNPEDYTIQSYVDSDSGPSVIYILALFGRTRASTWIFGTFFINKYYTVFDLGRNRIGFADSVPSTPEISQDSGFFPGCHYCKNNQSAGTVNLTK